MEQEDRRIYLIRKLLEEKEEYSDVEIPQDEDGQKRLLRGLMNVRMPKEAGDEFLRIQDEYLQEEQKTIFESNAQVLKLDFLDSVEKHKSLP